MQAYLKNGVVSLENSTGASPVELEPFISQAIYSDCDTLEDAERDCDDDYWSAGNLSFKYYENGEVAILRWTGISFEKIANGPIATLLQSNWDAVVAFSVANPTASCEEFLVFALLPS